MEHHTTNLFALTVLLALAACGEGTLSERIGMDRKPPDEFQVLSRPPLTVPPEFTLHPPAEAGEVSGLTQPASKTAESLVLGNGGETEPVSLLRAGSADTAVMPVSEDALGTTSDSNFLSRAGAGQASSDIRETIRKESGYYEEFEDKSMLEKLREPNKDEPMVDAAKEAERIEANEAEGKPIDEGDTPTKKPKDKGVLGKIF